MAKMTMLQMVQDILSDMESDEVGSISDTAEAEGIARIIRTTYFEMITNRRIPEHRQLIQLDSLVDPTRPTYMRYPDNLIKGQAFNYDKRLPDDTRKKYQPVRYIHPEDFLRRSNSLNPDEPNVVEVKDFSGVDLYIRNDRHPECWTTFDDEHIICDSYNRLTDTTLMNSKTQLWAKVEPPFFEFDDDFVPDIDSHYFPMLLSTAKLKCFDKYKSMIPQTEAQESRRQTIAVQAGKHRSEDHHDKTPDYGRKV